MIEHPQLHDLTALLAQSEQGAALEALEHVLGCEECRTTLRGLVAERRRASHRARLLGFRFAPRSELASGQPAFRREYSAHMTSALLEWQEARQRAAELLALPPGQRTLTLRNSDRFLSLAIAQIVLEESRKASFDDAGRGEALALVALEVLDRLNPDVYGERRLEDIRARAWAYLGNARRVAADLVGAEAAFTRGEACLRGTPDLSEEARFTSMLASLRKHQRRFSEALQLLDRAARIYGDIEDTDGAIRVLVIQGSLLLDQGNPEEALPPLRKALALLDTGEDARTALFARHNLTLALAELGRYPEAHRMFRRCRREYGHFDDALTRLRGCWLEAILDSGLGREERAEETFHQLRGEYAERRQPFEAGLVSLDLAALYAHQGRHADLRELAQEIVPIFLSRQLHREALIALTLFRTAVEQGRATREIVEHLSRHLKRHRLEKDG